MTENRYKIVIAREGQPGNEMAEISATVPASILRATLEVVFGDGDASSYPKFVQPGASRPTHPGTLKSVTITPAAPPDA